MKYLLHTDFFVLLLKQGGPRPAGMLERFQSLLPGDVGISALTCAELRYGAQRSLDPARNLRQLDEALIPLEIAGFGAGASMRYGLLRVALEKAGRAIGPMDMLIAAQAIDLAVPLVTGDDRDLSRVPGLRVENWAAGR